MNITDKIQSIEFDKNEKHEFGIKSTIIWGHSNENNVTYPLLYISKPKHISEEDYRYMINKLEIHMNK